MRTSLTCFCHGYRRLTSCPLPLCQLYSYPYKSSPCHSPTLITCGIPPSQGLLLLQPPKFPCPPASLALECQSMLHHSTNQVQVQGPHSCILPLSRFAEALASTHHHLTAHTLTSSPQTLSSPEPHPGSGPPDTLPFFT